MNEKDLLLGDRCILSSNVHSGFETSMKERIEAGIELMELPSNVVETIFCSSINKHTCVRQSPAFPNKRFVIIDEHHYYVISLLNHLFYLFGYDYPQAGNIKMGLSVFQIPYMFLLAVSLLLQTERFLLYGDSKQALSFAEELRELYKLLNPTLMCSEEDKFGWDMFRVKRIRNEYAKPYMTTFFAFHELAHIKFSLDENLRKYFFGLAEMEVKFFKVASLLLNDKYAKPSLLPIEDIACDTYSLIYLIGYFQKNGEELCAATMVEAYANAVLNQTFLDLYNKQTTNSYGWYKVCWWRMYISLEMLRLMLHRCKSFYRCKSLYDDIDDVRYSMHSRYANFSEALNFMLTNQETIAKSSNETHNMFSTNWNDRIDRTLSILREIDLINLE